MPNIFFISDTHFWHRNIIKNGGRPFETVDEMNRCMVSGWNAVVNPTDTVYHLGDVAMWKPQHLDICRELNGRKFLIRGNHDPFPTTVYIRVGFHDILAYKEFKDDMGGVFVCTHVPLHPNEVRPRWSFNVHGHIHQKQIQHMEWVSECTQQPVADPWYICVSVEQPHVNYRPISLDKLRQMMAARRG